MPFKVCSCPKRDMQREDTSYVPRKRKSTVAASGKQPTKMLCLQEPKKEVPAPSPSPSPSNSSEESVIETPHTVTITMPTKESMHHVLRCAYNEVSGMINDKAGHSQMLSMCAQNIKGLLGLFSVVFLV